MQHTTQRGAQLTKPPLKMIFLALVAVLLLVSALLLLLDESKAYSALLGGTIAIGPNAYFSYWAFRYSGAHSSDRVMRSFYRGEAGKFLLTTILFASVFALIRPLDVVTLFLSYIVFIALNWMLTLRYLNH